MIQSVKFDSFDMDIKKITNSALIFVANKLLQIFGFLISIFGVLLFISLFTYSPEDPNFIFPDNTEIKNFLGFRGSYISDIFFQSIGWASYLITLTLIFTGINIFKTKNFFLLIENFFHLIFYCITSTLFLSFFLGDAFELFINGNGGFVGNYLNDTFFSNVILKNENFAFYSLIILSFLFFY